MHKLTKEIVTQLREKLNETEMGKNRKTKKMVERPKHNMKNVAKKTGLNYSMVYRIAYGKTVDPPVSAVIALQEYFEEVER